jgi:16S rRNA (cytosine967-C5)-methyltransferase
VKPRLAARGSARAIAADVVARVMDDGAFTQAALASALSSSGMDARDKALATELVYGTLRWAPALEKSLLRASDKPNRGVDKRARPHMLVAAYQLQHLGERIPPHAAVSAAVDGVRAARPGLEGFANAILRKLGSALHETLDAKASLEDTAVAYALPLPLVRAIHECTEPAELRAALAGFNARPTTWAINLADVIPADARTHAFVPDVFALEGGAVTDNVRFKEGAHLVMDPGSVVCALLVGARPGDRVLDLCAAPGGKTVLLARAVTEGGRVVAVERDARRRKKIDENLVRTKLTERVEIIVKDVNGVDVPPADAVLLDAPCTGLGTTRRKPEIKLRRNADDIQQNHALQASLIEKACALTKPGGVFVYSVCSPIPEEGPAHVDAILARGFSLSNARDTLPFLPADAVDARGCVRLLPHRHDADAFFCARFRKNPA